MTAPAIVGLALHRPEHARPDRSGALAYFILEVAGFRFSGCVLRRNRKGELRWHPPQDEAITRGPRSVACIDQQLSDSVLDAAVRAYVALGGKGIEPSPLAAVDTQEAA